jgi:hypothetical protein
VLTAAQVGPITLDSTPPEKPTRHRDVVDSMYISVLSRPAPRAVQCSAVQCSAVQCSAVQVLSRPGSPISWNFGVKESITVAPPRPESASLLM